MMKDDFLNELIKTERDYIRSYLKSLKNNNPVETAKKIERWKTTSRIIKMYKEMKGINDERKGITK